MMTSEDHYQNPPVVSDARKWKALATVAMGTMMATMDASITNIAFPVLTRIFRTGLDTVMWVTVAYILTSTSSMLILGKISDLIGRKRIYTTGMVVFTLGLGACSLSGSVGQLIFFRTLQAFGAAMLIACGTAIVTEAFPSNEIGKGIGFLSMSVSVGFILGPVLGGFLLDWLDWRSIFYVRIPVGVATVIMALLLLEKDEPRGGKIRLDLLGSLTSAAGLFCIVFGLSQIKRYGAGSALVQIFFFSGLLLLILFVLVEGRARDPMVNLSLFRDRVFRNAMGSLFLAFVAATPYVLVMPFYLMQGLGLDPSKAGLLLAVNSMVTIISGPVGGWLSDRFGAARFAVLGAAAISAAFLLMIGFDLQTGIASIIPVLILLGAGVGTFMTPINTIIMGSVTRDNLGTASALIATLRQVGISVGMALVGPIFSARRLLHQEELLGQGVAGSQAAKTAIPMAFHDILILSVVIGSVIVLLCLFSGGGNAPGGGRMEREA